MFTVKSWKQSKCPLPGEGMRRLVYPHGGVLFIQKSSEPPPLMKHERISKTVWQEKEVRHKRAL